MKKQASKVYKVLKKNKKSIKIRAMIMTGFLFAINTFAWFVFITNGDGKINADVIAWDIAFIDEESQTELLDIELQDLYPGMEVYSRYIIVKNKSDLDATFAYELQDIYIFGEEYESEDLEESLKNDFPFSIEFNHDKLELDKGDYLNFASYVVWPFEGKEPYVKLNRAYTYNAGFTYYTLEDGEYVEAYVYPMNFDSLVETGLYLECDDADSYWGEKSVTYREENPEGKALTLKVKLVVTQKATE